MNIPASMRSIFTLMLFAFTGLSAQEDARKILARLGHTYDGLKDYTVNVRANVDVERMRVPKMEAKVYFKQPDKIHFESSGFALLPREGVFNPFQFTKDRSGKIVGTDTASGVNVLKVLLSQPENKKGPGVTIFIDTTRWVIVRAETQPYAGRNVKATFLYGKTGEWWLPSHVEVILDVQAADEGDQPPGMMGGSPGMSPKMPRKGKVTIDYQDYRVNQGLADEIFTTGAKNTK